MTDTSDRILIHEVINLHGHLMDEGHFDRLDELFTAEVVYDVRAMGGGVLRGRDSIAAAGRALGEANPLGHHVTNIVVVELVDDRAVVWSKGLGIVTGGSVGSVLYVDQLTKTADGWRIAARTVLPRTTPLQPSG